MVLRENWAGLIRDFHEKPLPVLVDRKLSIPSELPLRRAISIIGPRRAGKTFSIYLVIKKLHEKGVGVERVLYVNFERTDLAGCNDKDLMDMLEVFFELYPENKGKKVWLFLDEIQNVDAWEKFVRTIIDNENIQVFVSGSSSKLLSKEISTSLRGRTLAYIVLPFSFADYLAVEKVKIKKYFSSSEKSVILNKLSTFLENGGYPEAVLYKKEKEKIIIDIVETTVYRDVVERYKVRNIKLLKLLIKSCINSASREFSIHKFYNFVKSIGLKASKNSLYNYFNALNDVFFVFPVSKFSPSYKKAEQSLPKIHLVDNGILSVNGINDKGRLMENLVFVELARRGKNTSYYRSADGKEVDFVVMEQNKPKQLIQVSHSFDDPQTSERETSALLKASKELKCNNLAIITWNIAGEQKIKNKKIKYIPLWEWLLQKHSP